MRERRFDDARAVLTVSLEGFERLQSARSIIGVRYRLAMLAFETDDLAGGRALATRGVEDTQSEKWARLEGFNRRLLGDVARRTGDLDEARSQYDEALRLVPPTDMRIHAAIELSLAQLEADAGNGAAARTRAVVAQGHFEKLRMPKEAEIARRLAARLKAS